MAVSSLPLLGSTPPSASGVRGGVRRCGHIGLAGAGRSRLAPLQGLCPDELVELAPGIELGEARKLISHAHRVGALPDRSPCEVRRVSFDRVRAVTHVPSLTLRERVPSALDPFVKYVIETPAGGLIEAVKIPLENPARVSVCVSSQVGCGLGCTFCATGRMGLVRNLEAWEIIEQVRIVRRESPRRREGARRGVPRHGRAPFQLERGQAGGAGALRTVRPGDRRAQHHHLDLGFAYGHTGTLRGAPQRAPGALDRQRPSW